MISIFRKDNREFLAVARSEDSMDPGSLMRSWADDNPIGENISIREGDENYLYINPSRPEDAHGVEFVCHLHERPLHQLTGCPKIAGFARLLMDAMYSEEAREVFTVCLFHNWIKWDGKRFVFEVSDLYDEIFPPGARTKLGKIYLLSREIEYEDKTYFFPTPKALETREEYLRLLGAIE